MIWLAVLLATLAGATVAPASAATIAPDRHGSTLELRAELEARDRVLEATISFVWEVPVASLADRPSADAAFGVCEGRTVTPRLAVDVLARGDTATPLAVCARTVLLAASHAFENSKSVTARTLVPSADEARTSFSIVDRKARLHVESRGFLAPQRNGHLGPFEFQRGAHDGLRVLVRRGPLAKRTRRVVSIVTQGMSASDVAPLPDMSSADTREWIDRGRREGDVVRVDIDEPVERPATAGLRRWVAFRLVRDLLPLLFMAALLFFVWQAAPRNTRARRLAGLLMALVAVVYASWAIPGSVIAGDDAVAWLSCGLLMLAVVIACASAWRRPATDLNQREAWPRPLRVVLVVTVVLVGVLGYVVNSSTSQERELLGWLGLASRVVISVVLVAAVARIALLSIAGLPRLFAVGGVTVIVAVQVAAVVAELRSVRIVDGDARFMPFEFGDGTEKLADVVRLVGAEPYQTDALIDQLALFLPYAVLGCSLLALSALAPRKRTLPSERSGFALVVALFAAFVVGVGGVRLGLTIPAGFLLAVLVLLPAARSGAAKWLTILESSQVSRESLATWALASERIRRRSRVLELGHQDGTLGGADYATGLAELESERQTVAAGLSSPSDGREPRELVLAHGITGTWWGNAMSAVRAGAVLAVLPVAYYIAALSIRLSEGDDGSGYTSVYFIASGLIHEVVFWLVAAFCLGALLSVLPTAAGVSKGWVLAVAYIVLAGVGTLIAPATDDIGLAFRSFELMLFLMLVGVWLDRKALGAGWRQLAATYRLTEIGPAIVYVAPLLLSLIAIGEQVLTGDAQEAIQETIRSAPNLLP